MKSVAAFVLTYCVMALILFGDVLSPLAFLTMWSERLAIVPWRWIALGCTAFSAGVFLLLKHYLPSRPVRIVLFVVLSMGISTATIGIYSDQVRQERIASFAADEVIDHSFFRSIGESPRELQFYLHAAALKDCVAYAWSYRTMSFYRLPPRAAQNVVPRSWLAGCPENADLENPK